MYSDRSARRRRLMIAIQPEADDLTAPAWDDEVDEAAPPQKESTVQETATAREASPETRRLRKQPSVISTRNLNDSDSLSHSARLVTPRSRSSVADPSDETPPSTVGQSLVEWKSTLPASPAYPMTRAPRSNSTEITRLRGELLPSEMPKPIELCVFSQLTGESEIVRVDSNVIAIGRGSQCDIRLMHPDVSRRHACLQVLQTGVLCYDLGSRTGVLWNGQFRQVGWITPRQAAEIGPFEIRLATEDDHVAGLLPPPRDAWDERETSRPEAWLTAPTDPSSESLAFGFEVNFKSRARGTSRREPAPPQFVPLRNALTLVGRGKECEVQLRDQGISRVHSSVLRTAEEVWLMDLAGRGGVRVNGKTISQARLRPGDEVECGSHRLRFVARSHHEHGESPKTSARAVHSVGVDGYVSESLVLAMVETFADMQRQMRDQFQVQMDFMVDMVESMRQETRDDIRSELVNLKAIGEQIREAQSQLASRPVQRESETKTNARNHSGFDPSGSNAPEKLDRTDADRHSKSREIPKHYPRHFEEADQSGDGIADHLFVTRRLRELEKERETSWDRLVRMMKPGH